MKLVTIQRKEFYDELVKKGIARAGKERVKKQGKSVKKLYDRLTKYAHKEVSKEYKKYPIWCTFTKTSVENLEEGKIKIYLEVPDELVLLSYYDEWVSFRDYWSDNMTEEYWNKEFDNIFNVTDYSKRIQAIIPYVKKEWVINTEEYLKQL